MPDLDLLKSPIALGIAAIVLLAGAIAFGLSREIAKSDAAAAEKRLLAEAAPAESSPSRRRSRAENSYDGGIGFVVPYRPPCPAGSTRVGAVPPDGFEEACMTTGANAGIKHGWFAQWYEDGRPAVAGEYRDGLQVGVWTRWHRNGVKRVQAEFRDGLQHGRLISWDERGRKLGEQRFEDGEALSARN